MNQPSQRIDDAVVAICEQGCRFVNKAIDKLQHGQPTRDTMHLSSSERHAVLHELEDVMSVYDSPCDLREEEATQTTFAQPESLVLG